MIRLLVSGCCTLGCMSLTLGLGRTSVETGRRQAVRQLRSSMDVILF